MSDRLRGYPLALGIRFPYHFLAERGCGLAPFAQMTYRYGVEGGRTVFLGVCPDNHIRPVVEGWFIRRG